MEEEICKVLLKESELSLKTKDVPVGAVLVRNNTIISKGHNTREKDHSIISHAEINCITKASKKLKRWHLEDCTLYVSLKPCSMCESIIKQSRISGVVYFVDKPDEKKEYNKTHFMSETNAFSKQYAILLRQFFEKNRK